MIPTYNRAHLLPSTLESVLAQSHAPAEVIVVDDGSTDATADLMTRYDTGVRYHRVANGGVCRARNTGVRLSTSPWVAFCDSDDLWRPEKLSSQIRLLQRVPELVYVFCDFELSTEHGIERGTKFERAPIGYWDDARRVLPDDVWVFERALYSRLLRYQPIFPSTTLMHRGFFERLGGIDERWTWTPAEDVEFALRCVQHAPVGAVARPLVEIRKHTTNFSRQRLNSALGLAEIYRHAQSHHQPYGQLCKALLEAQGVVETQNAIEAAFAEGRVDIVRRLMPVVASSGRGSKFRLKLAIASLPERLAQPLCRALTAAATALARPEAAHT